MSRDWVKDIRAMHAHYGFHGRVKDFDASKLEAMLRFRKAFLDEELREMGAAMSLQDPDGVVDSLIDLCVVAIGTLDLFGVDGQRAWDRVHRANMSKEPGVKASRPNPLGLPDLIKPVGWEGPQHKDNLGTLPKALFVGEEDGPVDQVVGFCDHS